MEPLSSLIIFIAGAALAASSVFFILKNKINDKSKNDEELQDFDKKLNSYEQTSQNMEKTLISLTNSLELMKKTIDTSNLMETKQRSEITSEIKNLINAQEKSSEQAKVVGEEAKNLAKALTDQSKFQGDFGEINLKRILEMHGFKENIHYSYQKSFKDEKGNIKRPDYVIHLPDNVEIFIDCKVSLKHWAEYVSETDKNRKEELLKKNLESVKKHINELIDKDYTKVIGAKCDFVLCYFPIEPAYDAAFAMNEDLFLKAQKSRVMICRPSTIMFCLSLIRNVFQRQKINENVNEVSRQAGALYDHFVVLLENLMVVEKNMSKVSDGLQTAFNQIKQGRGSLISRIEKLKTLGVQNKKELPGNFKSENSENQNIKLIKK